MADEQVLNIKVKIDADTKKLTVVEGDLKQFEKALKNSKKAGDDSSKSLGNMESNIDSLMSPLGVSIGSFTSVAGAIGLVGATITAGISKWEEEKKLNREVAGVVNGLGLNYDQLSGSINSNLDALKANTRFTDEQGKKAFTQALKYTGDVEQSYNLLSIAQNVAVGTNKSLEDVMGTLGTALKGGERGTKALYTEFGKLGIQGKDVNEMITNLGIAYKNTAKNEESLEKTSIGMKEVWEDTAGGIGEQLSPALVELGEVIKPVIIGFTSFINLLVTGFMTIIDSQKTYARMLKDVFTGNFKDIKTAGEDFIKGEQVRWDKFGTSIIQSAERMKTGKEKADKDYGKFHAKTLKDELGDEKQFGKEKEELSRKLEKIKNENAKNSYDERMKILKDEVAKYRKAGADEKDITAYYEAEKMRISLDEQTRTNKAKDQLNKVQTTAQKKTIDGQIQMLTQGYQADLSNYKTQLANKEISATEYDALAKAREQQYLVDSSTMWQEDFQNKMSVLSSFMGTLTSVFGEATAVGKVSAIAQATMDTYAGANKALASYPPPFNFIAMATVIASGLANVSKISSIPLMAEGGILDKPTTVIAGEAGREAIIPLNSPAGKRILGGGNGGGVVIENIQIQFPNVSSFEDWRKADPQVLKNIVEKKLLYVFNLLYKEGKMTNISKTSTIS